LFGAGILGVLALRYALLLLVAAPLGTAAFLIHARLLGRLAWLLAYRTPVPSKAGSKKKKPGKRERALAVEDPWAFPEDAGVPTMDVEEVPPVEESATADAPTDAADPVRAGPTTTDAAQADAVQEEPEDEWTPRK